MTGIPCPATLDYLSCHAETAPLSLKVGAATRHCPTKRCYASGMPGLANNSLSLLLPPPPPPLSLSFPPCSPKRLTFTSSRATCSGTDPDGGNTCTSKTPLRTGASSAGGHLRRLTSCRRWNNGRDGTEAVTAARTEATDAGRATAGQSVWSVGWGGGGGDMGRRRRRRTNSGWG